MRPIVSQAEWSCLSYIIVAASITHSVRINQVCRCVVLHRIIDVLVSCWASASLPLNKVATRVLGRLVLLVSCGLCWLFGVWSLKGLHLNHVICELTCVQHARTRILMVQRGRVMTPDCTTRTWLKVGWRRASKVHLRSVVLHSVRGCAHNLLFKWVLSFKVLKTRVSFGRQNRRLRLCIKVMLPLQIKLWIHAAYHVLANIVVDFRGRISSKCWLMHTRQLLDHAVFQSGVIQNSGYWLNDQTVLGPLFCWSMVVITRTTSAPWGIEHRVSYWRVQSASCLALRAIHFSLPLKIKLVLLLLVWIVSEYARKLPHRVPFVVKFRLVQSLTQLVSKEHSKLIVLVRLRTRLLLSMLCLKHFKPWMRRIPPFEH